MQFYWSSSKISLYQGHTHFNTQIVTWKDIALCVCVCVLKLLNSVFSFSTGQLYLGFQNIAFEQQATQNHCIISGVYAYVFSLKLLSFLPERRQFVLQNSFHTFCTYQLVPYSFKAKSVIAQLRKRKSCTPVQMVSQWGQIGYW